VYKDKFIKELNSLSPPTIKICKECGEEFASIRGKDYCSEKCRIKGYARNHLKVAKKYEKKQYMYCMKCGKEKTGWKYCDSCKKELSEARVCVVCGGKISKGRNRSITCSYDCADIRYKLYHNILKVEEGKCMHCGENSEFVVCKECRRNPKPRKAYKCVRCGEELSCNQAFCLECLAYLAGV
jgi:hypothetical protein